MKTLRLFFLLCIIFGLKANNAKAQFRDDFLSSALDPAWTIVQTWPGGAPRVYGYTSPGNHFSLTDNPGYLRFWLDPMTHWDGFLNGYAMVPPPYYSCCLHDAGLEIHRTFSGDNWRFEAGGIFHMPFSNGRYFAARIYFGSGAVPTFWVQLHRGADVGGNHVCLSLRQKTGLALGDQTSLEDFYPNGGWYYGENNFPTAPLFFRVDRAGGVLTAYWSDDGIVWNTAWSHDLGNALDGLNQRVVVTGLCWFNPAGSFADWDYISVESTPTPVWIDIKPGSDPNAINPNNKGIIPLAILTDNSFDATTVDPLSVEFGPDGAKEIHNNGQIEDTDGDGDLDMVLHFDTKETGIKCGDTDASLTGKTTNNQDITGTDAIVTVGCGSKSAESIMQSEENPKEGYKLHPNYPNPFKYETEIRFYLPKDEHVLIKIYNINGESIRTLLDGQYFAGEHKILWDGTDGGGKPVPQGFYLYQIQAGSFNKVEKMSLIR